MRACGGCRRRKIKCDAATTNSWPCSACTRLKLQCDPPTLGQEREFSGVGYADFDSPTDQADIARPRPDFPSQPLTSQSYYSSISSIPHSTQSSGYVDTSGAYHAVPYPPRIQTQPAVYHDIAPTPPLITGQAYQQVSQPLYYSSAPQQNVSDPQQTSPSVEQSTAEGISEAFGELKIDDVGIGELVILENEI